MDQSVITTPSQTTQQSTLKPWFALVDMNSYFATLEQQANPFLRGKPVVIVKEAGRSCVIAASKEAKKFGVKTGEFIGEAKKKAPNLIAIPADFDRYFHNTKVIQSIFTGLSPDVDLFSLDEAFIDLKSCRNLYRDAEHFFQVCRQQVRQQMGEWVTFSIGLGANRLQAKLGSEFATTDGFFEITPDNLDAVLTEAKVGDICGIGFRLEERLRRLNIFHPYQINFYDDEFLQQHFGPFWSAELRKMGRGEENHFLEMRQRELPHMKSVSRSKTLFVPTNETHYIEQMILNLIEDMSFKARRMELVGRHLYLSLRDTDGGHWRDEVHLYDRYINASNDIFTLLNNSFHDISREWKERSIVPKIIKITVALSQLQPINSIPLSWFPEVNKNQQVFAGIDKINEKHGLYTVMSAKLLGFQIIKPEVTGFLGDKSYQMKFNE